jgi:RNA polymerase sigma-70 factor (ECF subfamily)
MTDALLVRRALDGDAGAFATLVDRHAPVCLRYATRMLGDVEDAEDVTQEALYRAHRALASYDNSMVFRTWLMTILVNRCRSAMLYRHRREERVSVDAGRVAMASVEADVAGMEARDAIERAMLALDADQREAFLLKHVEDLSYEEMSEITGAGVSALKMRVKRACERLREELEDDRVA